MPDYGLLVAVAGMSALGLGFTGIMWSRQRQRSRTEDDGEPSALDLLASTAFRWVSGDALDDSALAGLAALGFEDASIVGFDALSSRWMHQSGSRAGTPLEVACEGVIARAAGSEGVETGVPAQPGERMLLACRATPPEASRMPMVLAAWRSSGSVSKSRVLSFQAFAALLGAAGMVPEARERSEVDPPTHVDTLTGLLTRETFERSLQGRCEVASTPVAVLLVAVDEVKLVTGERCWSCGDEALRIAARRIECSLRPEDELARVEHSVFGVLLAEPGELATVRTVGARLLSALQTPLAVTGEQIRVQVRVGAVWDDSDRGGADRVLADAHEALERARGNVASSIRIAEPVSQAERSRR